MLIKKLIYLHTRILNERIRGSKQNQSPFALSYATVYFVIELSEGFVTTQNELRVAPTVILLCERTNQSKPQHFNHNKWKIMRKT